MPTVIPTFPDEPNYIISPTIDGVPYVMTFRLSSRENCYYADLALSDGTPLVMGKKIVCSVSLYARHRYNPQVPQGHLYCGPATGQIDDPPGLGELGIDRRCTLFYFTYAEVGG